MCAFVCLCSMKQLRERVNKLREDHERIYQLLRTEGVPTINWGNMMDEKLVGSPIYSIMHQQWSFSFVKAIQQPSSFISQFFSVTLIDFSDKN